MQVDRVRAAGRAKGGRCPGRSCSDDKPVACFDAFPKAAHRFAQNTGCTAYGTLAELLDDPNVDIVTICTPSGAHMEPAIAAARGPADRRAGGHGSPSPAPSARDGAARGWWSWTRDLSRWSRIWV
ncbi:MAG: Gfo/Idh/MocA family oxidoreductase [Proteobacteria bacterium]|nr:Gfo/Idh/MocA family oxidoreductase [Pseudomonadota bacterium]